MTTMGVVKNFNEIVVCRVLLGFFEVRSFFHPRPAKPNQVIGWFLPRRRFPRFFMVPALRTAATPGNILHRICFLGRFERSPGFRDC